MAISQLFSLMAGFPETEPRAGRRGGTQARKSCAWEGALAAAAQRKKAVLSLFLLRARLSLWMSHDSHTGLQVPLDYLCVFPADAEGREGWTGQEGLLVTRAFCMQSK